MYTHKLALGLGCLLVAACGTPLSQTPASAPGGLNLRLDPPPVHALLGHRAQLDLSSEQIDALDLIGQQVHSENHPLLIQIQEFDRDHRNPLVREELLKLAGKIYVNNHQAMERVRGVLTERQRADTCEAFAGSTMTARGLRTVTQESAALHAVNRPTTTLQLGSQRENGPVWSWCGEDATHTAAAH